MTRTPFKPTPSWSLCRPSLLIVTGALFGVLISEVVRHRADVASLEATSKAQLFALPSERALGHQRVLQSEEPPSGLILEEAAPIRSQLHQRSHGELADPVSTSADAGRPDATLQPVNAACCLA